LKTTQFTQAQQPVVLLGNEQREQVKQILDGFLKHESFFGSLGELNKGQQ